jgi:hypothetical protein
MKARAMLFAIIVILNLLLTVAGAHADVTIACNPSLITVSKVYDCTISVDLTGGAVNTDYTATATTVNPGIILNGAPGGPASTIIHTGSTVGSGTGSFSVRCLGNAADSGFVTITVGTASCTVQVNCEPCATKGPGDLTLKKGGEATTVKLYLPGMSCVSGKKMKAVPVAGTFVCVQVNPNPADIVSDGNVNGKATFTIQCQNSNLTTTEQIEYTIDPEEGLSDCYNYTQKITCTPQCPTQALGQNSSQNSPPMKAYIVPIMPETGLARVSFDMTGVDFTLVPGNSISFYYGTPNGPAMLATSAPVEWLQSSQAHVDQPLEALAPFFNGQWLNYFATNEKLEVLFLSTPAPCAVPCPADIAPPDGDGVVNAGDLLLVLNNWGPCHGCAADIAPAGGGNGVVDTGDLLTVINHWGPCP